MTTEEIEIETDTWKTINFAQYWNTVLGLGSAAQVVQEHELVADGLDEWLGTAEEAAWTAGGLGGRVPDEWAAHHSKALALLTDAT